MTVCFDEEFSLNGIIIGDYDDYIWFENGSETNHDLDEEVSIDGNTTFTLIATSIGEENIIINGDFEDGDSDFTTDYVIGTVSCFGLGFLDCEGTYGVIDDPSDGHTNFGACSDAVGGGNMLVINGAASLQEIWCQDVCVEPGATYVFSSWAASVNPDSPAQLQFAIDGGLIGNLFSLSSNNCDWEEFEAEWTASSETTVEICVTNQNTAAGGNDFALDGIQFVRVCEDEASFDVTHSQFEVAFNDPEEITCIQTESNISVIPTPSDDYTYEWESFNGNIIEFDDDGQSIIVDQAGDYFVTITNPLGCALEFEIEIEEDADHPELEITLSNPLNCLMPTAELEADADLNGIDFTWYDESQNVLIEDDQVIIDEGGWYFVAGSDSDTGCETTDSIFVDENFGEVPFEIEASTNLDCNNLSSTLSVSINFESIIWSNITSNETLGNFNSININSPGLYAATLTFDNGCTSSDSILITETNPNFEYTISYDSILDCNIQVSQILIDLDTSLYRFEWSSQNVTTVNTFTYSIVEPGNFLYQITDSLNCTLIDSIVITNDTTPPNISLNVDSISCTNTSAILSIDNPLDELSIAWLSENGTTINSDSIIINNPFTTTFTVTGTNGCTASGDYEVISIEQIPTVSIESNSITCLEPNAILSTNSNVSDLTYEWTLPDASVQNEESITTDIPGLYTLTVTSPTGCQSSTSYEVLIDTIVPQFQLPTDFVLDCNTTSLTGTIYIETPFQEIFTQGSWLDLTSLDYTIESPGIYSVEVISANGCTSEKSFEVSIDTISPIIAFLNVQELDCNSDGFDLEVDITNDYETLIWNGEVISNNALAQTVTSAGDYQVIAISDNGCETEAEVTISSSDDLPEFSVSASVIDCFNPESFIDIEISSAYAELNIYNENSLITNESQFETDATPLTIEVIGENGCSSTQLISLEIDTTTIQFELSAQELTCERTSTTINVENATLTPRIIKIFKVENGTNTESTFTVDNPGLYLVEVTNTNGCTTSQTIEIEEVGEFPRIDNFNTAPLVCETGLMISEFEIQGGVAPYNVTLDDVSILNFNESFIIEKEGSHIIEVTDSNGCATDTIINIEEIISVTSDIIPEITIKEGEEKELELTLNKPIQEIEIIDWSPKRDLTCYDCLTPTFTGNEETTYTIYVKDINGCEVEIETRLIIDINVKYFIPNVFGTVDNSSNNAFTIYDNTNDIVNIEFLRIYDRWGNLLFVNENFVPNDPSLGWDGRFDNKEVEEGVYVYFAILELRNGEQVKESGDVTFLK